MFRCGNQHGLNILVGQQIFVIAIGLRLRTAFHRLRNRLLQIRLIHIADRTDLHFRMALEYFHHRSAATAAANDRRAQSGPPVPRLPSAIHRCSARTRAGQYSLARYDVPFREFYDNRTHAPGCTPHQPRSPWTRLPLEKRNLKVAIFSKHLQFLKGPELASAAAEIGFDGIDLTVRSGGHVEPARVAEELPPLVSLIRQHHLEVPMVTTDIVDANSANARTVLKTLAKLGIRYYRWGGFKYRDDQPLARQFEELHQRSAQLAALNSEYKVCAIYHTHSGVGLVGAPVWDIFQILKGLDPECGRDQL